MTAFHRGSLAASDPEEELAFQMHVAGVPEPQRQHQGIPGRRFRFDFAWPEQKVSIEVHGGIWVGGRHVTGGGITTDCEKASLAAIEGWLYLVATSEQVASGQALLWVEAALKVRGLE